MISGIVLSQPTPQVTAEDVERIVLREFAASVSNEAFAAVNEYGTETWHRETDRVRVAALKLAAGDLERLRRAIESAKSDYRDVLAAAEYPAYCRMVNPSSDMPADERQRIIEADWAQYREWLARETG